MKSQVYNDRIQSRDCPHPSCAQYARGDDWCILHSERSDKDADRFEEAFREDLEEDALNCRGIVFPAEFSFPEDIFPDSLRGYDFKRATFRSRACFGDTTFKKVNFGHVTFEEAIFEEATFQDTTFKGATFKEANFEEATFKEVIFEETTFEGEANFTGAIFEGETNFTGAIFREAIFEELTFKNGAVFDQCFESQEDVQFVEANFNGCEFNGDVRFSGSGEENRAFAGGEVKFKNVTIGPNISFHFRYADLSRCLFLRTDLRKVEFTGVKWCEEASSDGRCFDEWFRRTGLYDEIHEQKDENLESDGTPPWPEIERLYRQLKRNYEDRGDFPRAGDFHIGEKVARRQNSQTHWGAQALLYAYRALSKYGERALPAFLWLLEIVLICAGTYAAHPGTAGPFEGLRLSMQATFFPVEPIDLEGPVGWVNLFSASHPP